jgi:hypothetical protein
VVERRLLRIVVVLVIVSSTSKQDVVRPSWSSSGPGVAWLSSFVVVGVSESPPGIDVPVCTHSRYLE